MKNSYLGNEFSDDFIKSELERYKIPYQKLDRAQLLETTAEEIKNGNVVGWFQGKMEWGPRALGNRSILAHPGFPNMKEILNARIKHANVRLCARFCRSQTRFRADLIAVYVNVYKFVRMRKVFPPSITVMIRTLHRRADEKSLIMIG